MSIQVILEVMQKLIHRHIELLGLGRAKINSLVNNEVDHLNAIVNKEAKLVRIVAELDVQRTQAIGEYLLSRGYNPNPNVTISDIVKIIFKAADEKQALMDARDELLSHIEELRKVNAHNKQLIEQSLAYIDYSLDLFLWNPMEDYMYKNPAQVENSVKTNGLFDKRA
jgi:flagellar biosynthesis/type III secretory pathway chaperone